MASVTTRANGSRVICFRDGCNIQKTITLGRVAERTAEGIKLRVEDLVTSQITGDAIPVDTAKWLRKLEPKLYAKLVRVDLAEPRESHTLESWLTAYLDERESELKPQSLKKLRQTCDKLLAFFKPSRSLSSITPNEAAEWRKAIRATGASEAYTKTHSGNAKTIFREAVKRRLIDENPFQHLKAGSTAGKPTRFVSRDEIALVIEACPSAEWRLLFGLARFAGLRIPSESHLLTWADISWDRGRMTVRSPKTERHAGHAERVIPIDNELMPLLQARFDECSGDERLVTTHAHKASSVNVKTIFRRSGVEVWPKLWQTLRASCEIDWAKTFPQFAVSRWIGHSITVSGKHYANSVPDELYVAASRAHNALTQPHAKGTQSRAKSNGVPERQNSNACARIRLRKIARKQQVHKSTANRVRFPPPPVSC